MESHNYLREPVTAESWTETYGDGTTLMLYIPLDDSLQQSLVQLDPSGRCVYYCTTRPGFCTQTWQEFSTDGTVHCYISFKTPHEDFHTMSVSNADGRCAYYADSDGNTHES